MISVDTIMALCPCSVWPRARVEHHVPHPLAGRDFLSLDSIPAPDRGWVACRMGLPCIELAVAYVETAASACADIGAARGAPAEAKTQIVLARHGLARLRKADGPVLAAPIMRSLMRDAACAVAWAAVARRYGAIRDLLRRDEQFHYDSAKAAAHGLQISQMIGDWYEN